MSLFDDGNETNAALDLDGLGMCVLYWWICIV